MRYDLSHRFSKANFSSLLAAVENAPVGTTDLYLGMNGLGTFKDTDLPKLVRSFPKDLKKLVLCSNELQQLSGKQLEIFFSQLSDDLSSLDLSGNTLGLLPSEDLVSAFTYLPRKLKKLGLFGAKLDAYSAIELATIFSNLPPDLEELDLGWNNLSRFTGDELEMIFKALPPRLICLILNGNQLGSKKPEELSCAFKALSWIKKLYLRINQFNKLLPYEFNKSLAELPPSIDIVDLRDNGLPPEWYEAEITYTTSLITLDALIKEEDKIISPVLIKLIEQVVLLKKTNKAPLSELTDALDVTYQRLSGQLSHGEYCANASKKQGSALIGLNIVGVLMLALAGVIVILSLVCSGFSLPAIAAALLSTGLGVTGCGFFAMNRAVGLSKEMYQVEERFQENAELAMA